MRTKYLLPLMICVVVNPAAAQSLPAELDSYFPISDVEDYLYNKTIVLDDERNTKFFVDAEGSGVIQYGGQAPDYSYYSVAEGPISDQFCILGETTHCFMLFQSGSELRAAFQQDGEITVKRAALVDGAIKGFEALMPDADAFLDPPSFAHEVQAAETTAKTKEKEASAVSQEASADLSTYFPESFTSHMEDAAALRNYTVAELTKFTTNAFVLVFWANCNSRNMIRQNLMEDLLATGWSNSPIANSREGEMLSELIKFHIDNINYSFLMNTAAENVENCADLEAKLIALF